MNTTEWLRAMGAVRPMAPAGDEILVLGAWRDGHYPIKWMRFYDRISRDINGRLMNTMPMERWQVFGISVEPGYQLTEQDCQRILKSAAIETNEPRPGS